jgi:tRNA-specific 2-thiouridylase
VATGHYARLVPTADGRPALLRGRDPDKDQSYVLWGIPRERLPRLLFPVGEHRKEEIREIAGRLGLGHVADKPDSQEICFIPDRDHARFVRRHRPGTDSSGQIVTTDGTVVGRHGGLERYTVGQRKGLGIAFGEPRYVIRLEPTTRRVVVGTREELATRELTAGGANWLIGPGVDGPGATKLSAQVKIRYRSPPAAAMVEILPAGRFRAAFSEACYGVAPGQAAVCYQGERVVGGGWIE